LAIKAERYDPEVSLLENLQNILGIEFPAPSGACDSETTEGTGDCGICYNYRLVSLFSSILSIKHQIILLIQDSLIENWQGETTLGETVTYLVWRDRDSSQSRWDPILLPTLDCNKQLIVLHVYGLILKYIGKHRFLLTSAWKYHGYHTHVQDGMF